MQIESINVQTSFEFATHITFRFLHTVFPPTICLSLSNIYVLLILEKSTKN